jgi:NAD(P)-dependent dehydrogenase (short-subunit alcohol dehydrogenase family)
MDLPSLSGRVVLVTGAARGIGAATARELAARGAHLALVGLEPQRLAALADELGGSASWAEADVTDQDALEAAVAAAVARHGRLDAVLANAGVASYGTVRQLDPAAFARVIDVNLTGVFRTLHATVPHLIPSGGYAMAVSSLAAFAPMAGLAPYAASKAGVEALALATRQEVAHLGVAVGVCHPGWVDTDMVRGTEQDLPGFAESRRRMPWPANQTTSVEDCARAVADGIAWRARRVYVPRGVLAAMVARPLTTSPLAERLTRHQLARRIPQLEEQVARLGRAFGRHTVS